MSSENVRNDGQSVTKGLNRSLVISLAGESARLPPNHQGLRLCLIFLGQPDEPSVHSVRAFQACSRKVQEDVSLSRNVVTIPPERRFQPLLCIPRSEEHT